jgi:hypothetical protein
MPLVQRDEQPDPSGLPPRRSDPSAEAAAKVPTEAPSPQGRRFTGWDDLREIGPVVEDQAIEPLDRRYPWDLIVWLFVCGVVVTAVLVWRFLG